MTMEQARPLRVYLGGPINGCTDEEAKGWRNKVKDVLVAKQYEWLDPMRRDYRGREMEPGIAEEIVKGDKDDIAYSDVCIFNCPKPSYGTAMEILYAYELGKTVLVVLPNDDKEPSPWIVYHANKIIRGSAVEAALGL